MKPARVRAVVVLAIAATVAAGPAAGAACSESAAVVAGEGNHTLSIGGGGLLRAWGSDSQGQLGDGTISTRRTPVRVGVPPTGIAVPIGPAANVVAIAAGYDHALALAGDGKVYTWGARATTSPDQTPTLVPRLPEATAIDAGLQLSIVRTADGEAWTWGTDVWGGLGDDTSTARETAAPALQTYALTRELTFTLPLRYVKAVSASSYSAFALLDGGDAYGWGRNAVAQLGNGSTSTAAVTAPARVAVDPVKQVSAGPLHGVAVLGDGDTWAWGIDADGQLGNTGGSTATPDEVGAC